MNGIVALFVLREQERNRPAQKKKEEDKNHSHLPFYVWTFEAVFCSFIHTADTAWTIICLPKSNREIYYYFLPVIHT